MTDRFDMTNKVVLITGGSHGLGRAMALGFAESGADVAITSRKLDSCKEAAAEVEARGRRAFAYACHVGHWDALEGLVDAVYFCSGFPVGVRATGSVQGLASTFLLRFASFRK